MKKIVFVLLTFSFFCTTAFSQPGRFDPAYRFVHSSSLLQDKIFYLLTLFQQIKEVYHALCEDTTLRRLTGQHVAAINALPANCKNHLSCYAESLLWKEEEIDTVKQSLQALFQKNAAIRQLPGRQLRPSGNYQRYAQRDDETLLLKAWQETAEGMNYIIRAYLLNRGLRYAAIDSVSYPVNGAYYAGVIQEMLFHIQQQSPSMNLFFEPTLEVCLQLLDVNQRDEAVRYEPLAVRNQPAYEQIGKTVFSRYPYAAILVLGEGPENGMAISPNNKYRCQTAAARYKSRQAPFVIVSGGHVHPFQTPYCEAVEMKKYLMQQFAIPARAIIIEPYARHTTTNFRNANRILYRNHWPSGKKLLCVTSKSHTDYLNDPLFGLRSIYELGYAPFRDMKRIGEFDTEYTPVIESLQINTLDPLDP